jgi:hypothetical protein
MLEDLGLDGGTTDQVHGKSGDGDGAFSWRDDETGGGGGGAADSIALVADYIVGRYYRLVGVGIAYTATQTAGFSGRAILTPFTPDRTVTFDELGAFVVTGVASAQIKVLVYASGVDGYPGALVWSSGAIAAATSSTYASTGTSIPTLTGGTKYWVGIVSDSTSTLRALGSLETMRSIGGSSTADGGQATCIFQGITFATPPDPWGFSASQLGTIDAPAVVALA